MDQHEYGQTNSWFLISSLFFLDTPDTYINIYLHTSSLIKSVQSDFPNLYSYKQTNVENIPYSLYIVCIVISPLLDISSLMHSWFILQPWSKLVHYQTLVVHAKQAIIETNPKSSTHVSFAICQICLLPHDTMISHNIEAISLIPFALLSFAWTRLFPWSSNTTTHNFGLHLNNMWNITKFSFLLNLYMLIIL
jgi:hypothetical protein